VANVSQKKLRKLLRSLDDEIRALSNIYSEDAYELERALLTFYRELPEIREVEHKGRLRIFAFSDYRVHDINLILEILSSLKSKPHLVIYAGDDVERFAPPKVLEFSTGGILYRKLHYEKINENFFEKIAKKTRHGLIAVAGNDDPLGPVHIHGENVFDGYRTWIKIGSFLIIGLEGATVEPSELLHREAEYIMRLELAKRLLQKGEKIIIVSHVPPRGLLDYAQRFGERHVGSKALRIFLDNNLHIVALVICGHVHREGGKKEFLKNTLVVNVASHDFVGDRGIASNIVLNAAGKAEKVDFIEIPSPLEQILKSPIPTVNKIEELVRLGFKRNSAQWLIDSFAMMEDVLLEQIKKYPWMLSVGSLGEIIYELPIMEVPLIGPSRANLFKSIGIKDLEQLVNLDPQEFIQREEVQLYMRLSEDRSFPSHLPLIVNYAKALLYKKPIVVGVPRKLVESLRRPITFLDLEYDPSRPFIFVVGILEEENIWQAFAENEEEEKKALLMLAELINRKTVVTYAGKGADIVILKKRFPAYGIKEPEFSHIDLYFDIINTRNTFEQVIFLPIKGMSEKSVAEFFGYKKPPDLKIEDGFQALLYFNMYLKTRDEKIKEEILRYNKCDLERAQYIYLNLLKLFHLTKEHS